MALSSSDREFVWRLGEHFGVPGHKTIDVDPTLFPSVCPRCTGHGTAPASASFFGLSMRDPASAHWRSLGLRIVGETLKGALKLAGRLLLVAPFTFLIGVVGSLLAWPIVSEANRTNPRVEEWVVTLWFCGACRGRFRLLEWARRTADAVGLWLAVGGVLTFVLTLRSDETLADFGFAAFAGGFVLICGLAPVFRYVAARHHGVTLRFDEATRELRARFHHPGVLDAMERAYRDERG